jgi:nicotinamide riboside transporter PnuC
MRFAWQRKNSADEVSAKQSSTGWIIYIAYNIVYWLPLLLTVTKIIDYRTGFIMFVLILIIRAAANLYRNNVPTADQGEYFALRSP